MAEYTHQALDDELLDYLFEPAFTGLSYWVPEHTSQVHLFLLLKLLPRFVYSAPYFVASDSLRVRRVALDCIPGATRKHSEGGAWITQPT